MPASNFLERETEFVDSPTPSSTTTSPNQQLESSTSSSSSSSFINRIRSRSTSQQIPSIETTSCSPPPRNQFFSQTHPHLLSDPLSIDRSSGTPDFTLNNSGSPRRIAITRAQTQANLYPPSSTDSNSIPSPHPAGKDKPRIGLSRSNSERNCIRKENSGEASGEFNKFYQVGGV